MLGRPLTYDMTVEKGRSVGRKLGMPTINRRFSKDAQTMIIDAMCRQTNLINCNSWDFLKVDKNASTKKLTI